MHSILPDHYFALFEVLVVLFLIGGIWIAVYLGIRWRWQKRLAILEKKHADDLVKHDSQHFQALYDHLQSAVAHEFVKGLDYISKKSTETLEELGEGQNALRDKQRRITAKANEMTQHALNILAVLAPEWDGLQKELLSIRQLVEGVLLELYAYAQSTGVTLRPKLDDVEPTFLDRDLTLLAIRNVIHNAIKYSLPGGIVEIVLFPENPEEGADKKICVEVKDRGKGIPKEDQDSICDLKVRGDGLIEPGSGLGLNLARKSARRQGGDVILAHSGLNQGSLFRIILPHTAMIDYDA